MAVLKQKAKATSAAVGKLVSDGVLETWERRLFRDPLGEPIHPDQPLPLTADQQAVMRQVEEGINEAFRPFLLEGVTGSGKTEIYLQLADQILAKGRQVLVLVPEIALISQTERRFKARFGDRVAILHSGLTAGERYDQWVRIARGERPVVIGARSALFAPLAHPGLLIVDEEHDTAFKQETGLRYNARDLAVVRAKLSGASVLLGSATPSVQSLHNAHSGRFVHLRLSRRIEERPLAEVEIVDLKAQPSHSGVQRYLSRPLFKAIGKTLAREEQVLLFLNRRGFSGYAVCGACGHNLHCRHCDVAMTLHQAEQQFKCHYCGYSQAAQVSCPNCGGSKLIHLGIGTERLESMVTAAFPAARVARLDRDTARRKDALRKTLQRLRRRKIDILIGTQMVAKGHDFPFITLVGIVCADSSLHFPDFRAGERTFQLLAQVAGRAGRGERPGRVILQTYSPDNFILRSAQAQRMQPFYEREIDYRRALAYPPFSRLALLLVSGRDQHQVARCAVALTQIARKKVTGKRPFSGFVQVLGPVEAPLSRLANRYRYQVLLKGASSKKLREFLVQLMAWWQEGGRPPGVRIHLDIDPYSML
jgi:primosomal protein N' (replication factor Y)